MRFRVSSKEELLAALKKRDALCLPSDWRAELYEGSERIGAYQAYGVTPPGIVYIDLQGRHDQHKSWSFFDDGGYILVDDGEPPPQ